MTTDGAIGCASLVTCAGGRAVPILDAVVAWESGQVTFAGSRSGYGGTVDREEPNATVVPGFVDCHTHVPFMGWRDDEFEARLTGATYRDQHGRGGGIARSARMFAEASDQEVLAFSRSLLDEMLDHGTTSVELKTGYGLSLEAELRQARLARRLADEAGQTCTVTLLGCHAVPEGMERSAWVDVVCTELIPAAASEGLVDGVDVYVEDIAFSIEDLERVAGAAEAAGLPVRCHAEQLGHTGAAAGAAAVGARSADHLNHLDAAGARAMADAGTTAVLLPASTLMLRAQPPPVETIAEAGAAVAVASDCNPGTSPVLSMPLVIALACSLYGLTPEAAVAAATIEPARVLGLDDRLGSLKPGKQADLVVLEGEHVRMLPYRPGHHAVRGVVVAGEWVRDRA